jgi:tetratricopeptide (TPR) repeat protein
MRAMSISRAFIVAAYMAAFVTVQSLTAHAAAQGMEAARAAFAQGSFLTAAEIARPLGTAEGAALAARAELAQGDFIAPPSARRERFEQAEKDARTVIALDPTNAEGHLYLALALGFLGRMDGSVAAHFAGYAAEARAHIDKALALAPDSPWPLALSGGWNLEIVHDGGMIGETIYGASVEKGCADYARALEIDPGNTAIAYQYALQLAAMGSAQRRAQALRVLGTALQSQPDDALETLSRRRAQHLKLVLDTHDEVGLKTIIRDQLGTPATIPPGGNLRPLGATGSPR